jgi:glycosyltransferase involved in cell wall biosynthesis
MDQRDPSGLMQGSERNGVAAWPSVALVMPVLNEIDGLRAMVPRIDRRLFDDIVVIDGGSTDGSTDYAREQKLSVVTQRRAGLAEAVIDAIGDLSTDAIVTFSPDGNCLPERLPAVVAGLREGHDVVVVSRYLPPAHSLDDTPLTAFGNRLFTWLIRGLGRAPLTDTLNIYRGFRRTLPLDSDFQRYLRGPVLEPLTSALATLRGLRILEVAGDEPARIGGQSKMRPLYNGSCISLMIARLYLRKWFGSRT